MYVRWKESGWKDEKESTNSEEGIWEQYSSGSQKGDNEQNQGYSETDKYLLWLNIYIECQKYTGNQVYR